MQLQRTHACAPVTTRGRALLLSGNCVDTVAYANGKSVVQLNVRTMAVETYNEHTAACTAVRFSPCGKVLASGDASGCVRVWDAGAAKCRVQVPALGGAVSDVALSRDLKTVFACGEGRGRLAGAFNADTGGPLAALSGLSKPGNALDLAAVDGATRLAVADDAGSVHVYDGTPPFKHRFSAGEQSGRAVNSVRFSPTSSAFVAAGGKATLLYTGDGVTPTELSGHAGATYGASWEADGARLMTAGQDKTVRLWDVKSARELSKHAAGDALEDTQMGCLWLAPELLVSASLGGDLLLFDPRMAGCITRVLAHQRAVTAMAADAASGDVWSADYSGRVLRWSGGRCTGRMPAAHTNSVVGAALCGEQLATCGLDDKLFWAHSAAAAAPAAPCSAPLPCAPKTLCASADGLVVLATVSGVTLARAGAVLASTALAGANAAAITRDGAEVAVGCANGGVHVFAVAPGGAGLQPRAVLAKHRETITALEYDAAGAHLASCDTGREVVVWDRDAEAPFWRPSATMGRMQFHTARIACLAWSPDGQHLATGGLDCSILIWALDQPPSKRVSIAGAHRDGVTTLRWSANDTLVSAGGDACVRVWASA